MWTHLLPNKLCAKTHWQDLKIKIESVSAWKKWRWAGTFLFGGEQGREEVKEITLQWIPHFLLLLLPLIQVFIDLTVADLKQDMYRAHLLKLG